jgi:cytochrome c oxidase subunit 2
MKSAFAFAALAGVQSSLQPFADQSRAIDVIWQVMLWTCTLIYVGVLVGLVVALLRRTATAADDEPAERRASAALVLWTGFIAIVLVGLTAASYSVDRQLLARDPNAMRVRVTAKQWWWQVEYLDRNPSLQFVTANELHLPVDRMTRVELVAGDVIHSLWIPNLNGKSDLIPGRKTDLALTPRQVGRFRGQCAEFCGLQHAHMALDVQIDNARDFAAWRRRQLQPAGTPAQPDARRGAGLFQTSACVMCHAISGTEASGRTGPDLTHFASRRTIAAGTRPLTRGDLAAWLSDPQRLKPGNNMPSVDLEPDELNALVAYLMTLQ